MSDKEILRNMLEQAEQIDKEDVLDANDNDLSIYSKYDFDIVFEFDNNGHLINVCVNY